VEPGQKIAIVGQSGAGKSTIAKLIYRLYDVQGGTVRINGQSIAECTQRSVRCAIGRAVQVDPIKLKLKPPGTKRLKLNCDVLLSTSAFEFNLRRYTSASCRRTACCSTIPSSITSRLVSWAPACLAP
jgi:ABC-type oligopeptide transport system ATPase subunit